jgi:hypothetical protein
MSMFFDRHEYGFIDIEVATTVALNQKLQSRLLTNQDDAKVLASCYSLVYNLSADLFTKKDCQNLALMQNTKHYLANLCAFMAASQHTFMAVDARPVNLKAGLKHTARRR